MDQDTQAVVDRLAAALGESGLSLRRFADALGTSSSRFSAYLSGRTAPSAAFLLRAERIAGALCRARSRRVPSSLDALESVSRAVEGGDEDWAYALELELRDRLRDVLLRCPDLAAAWETRPPAVHRRWRALAAAFVSHEFTRAGRIPPAWTCVPRLDPEWVLDTPRLTGEEVRSQTPAWLAERGLYLAAKDMVTR